MKLIHPFPYQPLTRQTIDGVRKYNTPDGKQLPSVTTILSATKDMTHLNEWKDRVGTAEATRIVTEASDIGGSMHDNLERYVLTGATPTGTLMTKLLTRMIIERGLKHVTEVWGTEVGLYTKDLYAGTTDLVGCHKGVPAIMDYKNSLKPKKKEWITDYRAQLGAYALSHNEMYNTTINKGVLMIGCRSGEYQEYVFEGKEFTECIDLWLTSLDKYFSKTS